MGLRDAQLSSAQLSSGYGGLTGCRNRSRMRMRMRTSRRGEINRVRPGCRTDRSYEAPGWPAAPTLPPLRYATLHCNTVARSAGTNGSAVRSSPVLCLAPPAPTSTTGRLTTPGPCALVPSRPQSACPDAFPRLSHAQARRYCITLCRSVRRAEYLHAWESIGASRVPFIH